MASQMADCQQDTVSVTVYAGDYRFKASGYTVTFDGFTVLYEEATDEKEKKETSLPPLEQGQLLKLKELKSEQKFTQPPARYTEATLIKALEENGIGRPSTYAPIITTIIDRGYVEREQKKLKPTLLGRAVDGLMLEQFPHIVDVDFSAEMEMNLDKIESGKADWHKTVDDFYQGFAASLEQAEKNMEGKKVKVPDEPSSEVCDLCGRPMVIKVGKYGKFLACSGFPECRGTKRLVKDTGGICPKCGKGRMLERKSAKGRIYYGCGGATRSPPGTATTAATSTSPGRTPQSARNAAPPSSARAPSSTAQKRAAALRCRCRRRIDQTSQSMLRIASSPSRGALGRAESFS